jgi:hypothetical protein
MLLFTVVFVAIAWWLYPVAPPLGRIFPPKSSISDDGIGGIPGRERYLGSHRWAQYAPWYAVEVYREPPRECQITQVTRSLVVSLCLVRMLMLIAPV